MAAPLDASPEQSTPSVVPEASPQAPSPAQPSTAQEDRTAWWPWALAALLALVITGVALRRRRPVYAASSERIADAAPPEAIDVPIALTAADPVLEPAKQSAGVEPVPDVPVVAATVAVEPAAVDPVALAQVAVASAPPKLKIEFKPAVASTGDTQTSVEFALIVANHGGTPARRVRMEARMFAMGSDHDAALAAFFREPLDLPIPIASSVPPDIHAALRSQVSLPRTAVRPLEVRNRQLFVPLVAFKVFYEWDAGNGDVQTAQVTASYVVGREANPPSEKMAPFRLDQGPRMYREVGQRAHRAA